MLDKDEALRLRKNDFLLRKEFLGSNQIDGSYSAFSPQSKNKTSNPPATYTIKKGDTLYAIAKKFKLTEQQLVRLNKLKKKGQIKAGQKLRLR